MSIKYKSPFTRVRGNLLPTPLVESIITFQYDKFNAPSTFATEKRVSLGYRYVGDWMLDVVTPGYKELITKGKIINNPCSKKYGWYFDQPFMGDLSLQTYIGAATPNTGAAIRNSKRVDLFVPDPYDPRFLHPSLPDKLAAKQQAMNEAIAKSHQRDVMGIVDLAEMGKTLDMLRTQLGRFDKLRAGSLFKGKPQTVRKNNKGKTMVYQGKSQGAIAADVSGLWLEVQYGIIPLMLSIDGLVRALGDPSAMTPAKAQTFRAGERYEGHPSRDNVITEIIPSSSGATSLDHHYIVDVDYRYQAHAGINTFYRPNLRERLGTMLRDLPAAGYELIPYSFVIDWFWDMGTYLEAATPVKGFTSNYGFSSLSIEEVTTFTRRANGAVYKFDSNRWDGISYPYEMSRTSGIREYYRYPGISAGIPSINRQLNSWKHMVSGAALAISFVNRKATSKKNFYRI